MSPPRVDGLKERGGFLGRIPGDPVHKRDHKRRAFGDDTEDDPAEVGEQDVTRSLEDLFDQDA